MDAFQALAEFDGTHIAPLKEVVAGFQSGQAELLDKACHGPEAVAATWVVKALLEQGRGGELDLGYVFTALRGGMQWEALLHLLQIVQHAPDAAMSEVMVIRGFLDHPKTLIRVWALDAFVRLALVDHTFLPEAVVLVEDALNAKASSVRARGRALRALLS